MLCCSLLHNGTKRIADDLVAFQPIGLTIPFTTRLDGSIFSSNLIWCRLIGGHWDSGINVDILSFSAGLLSIGYAIFQDPVLMGAVSFGLLACGTLYCNLLHNDTKRIADDPARPHLDR